MGNIRCLNCKNEITTISGMECPHCKTPLTHVKIAFLSYLGPEDSLAGYQRSYKLVLFKAIFELIRSGQEISAARVSELFRQYYINRKKAGLPADKEADARITNIESSDLRDIWLLINMNPFAAISKHGFLKIKGDGLNGVFVLQKGIDALTPKELSGILDLVDKKLNRYFDSIGSAALPGPLAEFSSEAEDIPAPSSAGEMPPVQHVSNTAPEHSADDPDLQTVSSADVVTGTYESAPGHILLEDLPLSTRAFNAFKRSGMTDLSQLRASFHDGSIAEIRNIGRTVIEEVSALLEASFPERTPQENAPSAHTEIRADGVFSGEMDEDTMCLQIEEVFADNAYVLFRQYCIRNGLHSLGDLIGFPYANLMAERGFGQGKMMKIIEKWTSFLSGPSMDNNVPAIPDPAPEYVIEIHESNWPFGISLIPSFPGFRRMRELLLAADIKTLGDLHGCTKIALSRKLQHEKLGPLLSALEHFKNPYSEVLDEYFEKISNEQSFDVFVRRTEGKTLQAIGEEFGITRERVRQICVKIQRHIMPVIHPLIETLMQQNGAKYFREEQIRDFAPNELYANAIVYTLCEADSIQSFCSPRIFFETSDCPNIDRVLKELASDIVGDGINIFESAEDIEKSLDNAGFGFLTADDFLGLLIEFEFTFYGDYILQDRKSYGKLCARIVAEFFPDGISNSAEDMSRLRELAKQQYGDLDLPDNDRAVYARICDHLILRGRSTYIAPSKVFIDEDILSEIKKFIDESKQKDIFYAELFAEFEGLLMMMTNIDNHQFLHGVLRHYYPADYSYSRDFLSKESGEAGQSLADRITAYISGTGCAVSKKDILRQFPGISEVVLLNAAYKFTGLLQWEYGYFNSLDNLHLTDADVQRIDGVINSLLEENDGYCSEAMLYSKAQSDLADVIEKSSVKNGLNLFYAAQELLAGKYSFRSPHIARNGRFESLNVIDIARSALGDGAHIKASDYFRTTKRFMWPEVTASMAFAEIEKDYIRLNADEYVCKTEFILSEPDLQYVKALLDEAAGSSWFLSLQVFMDSEDELPSGIAVNEFIVGALVTEYKLGWHVVSPKMKDRRYQRGILVRDNVLISAYDELISCVLNEQNINSISETDLLGLLQIHSLVCSYLPKELQHSEYLAYSDGMYSVK